MTTIVRKGAQSHQPRPPSETQIRVLIQLGRMGERGATAHLVAKALNLRDRRHAEETLHRLARCGLLDLTINPAGNLMGWQITPAGHAQIRVACGGGS